MTAPAVPANDNKPDPVDAIAAAFESAEQIAPQFSDDAVAQEFSRRHADDLRYVAVRSQWFRFDGKRWAEEKTLLVYDRCRAICRELSEDARGSMKLDMTSKKKVA